MEDEALNSNKYVVIEKTKVFACREASWLPAWLRIQGILIMSKMYNNLMAGGERTYSKLLKLMILQKVEIEIQEIRELLNENNS
jgi:hypothetical protein